jgi:death-on-curing protein
VTEPAFLALGEVLAIHRDQIRRYGGRPGIRDPNLLASALGAPAASYGGEYLHTDSEIATFLRASTRTR